MTGAGSTFHVDLRGVVDLMSHHLYSSPRVHLRELLQSSDTGIGLVEDGIRGVLAGRHPLSPFDSALVARALPSRIDRAVDGGTA